MKIELTEQEAKTVSLCLQEALTNVSGHRGIGVGNPQTETNIVNVLKKIAKENGYD